MGLERAPGVQQLLGQRDGLARRQRQVVGYPGLARRAVCERAA